MPLHTSGERVEERLDQGAAEADPIDFATLFQQAPCGYLITGDNGVITAVNDTFINWSGHRRDALLGTNMSRLMPVGDRILYSTRYAPQLRISGTIAEALIEIVGADGVRRPALLSASRTPAAGTQPAQIRVIVFGAAERRRYEQELVAALQRTQASETLRVAAEAGLQHLTLHDPLTGLPNRPGFTTALDQKLATRGCDHVAVLVIDLDRFKAVNDSLGRAAADELLIVVAQRLRSTTRETSTVARLSGDEFAIVGQLDAQGAAALGRRLLQDLAAPVVLDGLEVRVSASIGGAVAGIDDDTAEALLRRGEIGLHRAKALGRGRVEFHEPSDNDPEVQRLHVLGQLRSGIAAGQLRVHYQPRVDLRTAQFVGAEALVRWQHPTRGLLPPSEFIDVAEESGLVRELGAWVLREAVHQAARWNRDGAAASPVTMAVNLSTRQLSQPDIVELVASVLAESGFDPADLTLEITETALMHDARAAAVTLRRLKALGVRIAIDDFGTGYGSLTYLQQFPIDELKIDRSFVAQLGSDHDRENSAIVAACVQLAHAVGIDALAEGVETEAQRPVLIDLGCDLAQGYYFARPLTAEGLLDWLGHQTPGRQT